VLQFTLALQQNADDLLRLRKLLLHSLSALQQHRIMHSFSTPVCGKTSILRSK
jgi:hypothetical protein